MPVQISGNAPDTEVMLDQLDYLITEWLSGKASDADLELFRSVRQILLARFYMDKTQAQSNGQ